MTNWRLDIGATVLDQGKIMTFPEEKVLRFDAATGRAIGRR